MANNQRFLDSVVSCSRWDDLGRWYSEVGKDPSLWLPIQQYVNQRLTAMLRRRLGEQLALWEITEAAEFGFLAMFLQHRKISTWPQAWVYAQRAASSKARERLRRCQLLQDLSRSAPRRGRTAPASAPAEEFTEVIGRLLSGLCLGDLELLTAWVKLCLLGQGTLSKLAQQFKLTERTLDRRICALRQFLVGRLAEMHLDIDDLFAAGS